MAAEQALRVVAVWCPDWPVTAAVQAGRASAGAPVAVLSAGRVLACSPAAREEGVRRGLLRREAQSRCPELTVLVDDPDQQARAFEPVAVAVESACPGVEVLRPGLVAVPARGPARYYGGEPALVEHLAGVCEIPVRIGVADGLLAASLAARATDSPIVPPGESRRFLATHPVDVLERPELAELLRRLGLSALGDFAALSGRDVLGRFGFDGAIAHRLARGLDARPFAARPPVPGLAVHAEFDPPLDRVDAAAFAARSLAGQLHEKLSAHALGCLRLLITVRTENGEEHARCWRHNGMLSLSAITDRVRWQLDGWLSGQGARPSSGIADLTLAPEDVLSNAGQQLDLWGVSGEAEARADRALVRVQGMLGPTAVVTPVHAGGRGLAQIQLIAWGDPREPDRDPAQPWPGRLPAPSPSVILAAPTAARVLDDAGEPVRMTDRGALSAAPARLALAGAPGQEITGWAGPWPIRERWWDEATARESAYFQMVTADGVARLIRLTAGRWQVEAVYE